MSFSDWKLCTGWEVWNVSFQWIGTWVAGKNKSFSVRRRAMILLHYKTAKTEQFWLVLQCSAWLKDHTWQNFIQGTHFMSYIKAQTRLKTCVNAHTSLSLSSNLVNTSKYNISIHNLRFLPWPVYASIGCFLKSVLVNNKNKEWLLWTFCSWYCKILWPSFRELHAGVIFELYADLKYWGNWRSVQTSPFSFLTHYIVLSHSFDNSDRQ